MPEDKHTIPEDELRGLVEDEWNMTDLADHFGCTTGAVRNRLDRWGLEIDEKHGPGALEPHPGSKQAGRGRQPKRPEPDDSGGDLGPTKTGPDIPDWGSWDGHLGWLAEQYRAGATQRELADRLPISICTVNDRLDEAGVDTRDPHAEGPDNPNWQGGSDHSWRLGTKWQRARGEALDRDGRACQDCGVEADPLDVHHIEPVSEGGDKYDPNNLVALCGPCHRARHGWPRKIEEGQSRGTRA